MDVLLALYCLLVKIVSKSFEYIRLLWITPTTRRIHEFMRADNTLQYRLFDAALCSPRAFTVVSTQ